MMRSSLLGLVLLAAACAEPSAPFAPANVPSGPQELFSDPAEYADHGISAAQGEGYFARLGGGDPYATGLAYPVWLALVASYPAELGGTVARFADKFGFVPDPAAPDGLPLGLHLTLDPRTQVPFRRRRIARCATPSGLRLPDGDRIVSGLGSTRVRIHAYDEALVHVAREPSFTTEHILAAAAKEAREKGVPWPGGARVPIVQASVAEPP